MRPAILLLPLLFLFPAACASSPRTTATSALFAPEIEALNRELEERFRAGNLLGVADLYADDALLITPTSVIEGRGAIDAYWSEITVPVSWRLVIFEIGGSEDLAYQLGRSQRVWRSNKAEHSSEADFLLIWKKDAEGGWKIAIDTTF
jgi:uncharacterized protein (TIGR02246 family)